MLEKKILKTMRFVAESAEPLWAQFRRLFGRIDMLYLEVTHACNLKCVSCYTNAGLKKRDELTFEEKKSVIRQAKKMGARFVSLSGSGEPLLYKDIFTLIDYIRELNMGVTIFTNGTPLDKDKADFLLSRRVKIFVKLYSLDPDVFDRMVGVKNAYKWVDYSYTHNGTLKKRKIPQGLKHLLDLRSAHKGENLVKAEALITKINHSFLPEVARFCREINLPFLLETQVFKGHAIGNYSDIALDSEEYSNLYNNLTEILGEKHFGRDRNRHTCPVERNPVVWTNGEVGFCSSRGASIGNVLDLSLKKLFSRAKRAKRKEDRWIAKLNVRSRFFNTCRSRQYHEAKYNLPCNY